MADNFNAGNRENHQPSFTMSQYSWNTAKVGIKHRSINSFAFEISLHSFIMLIHFFQKKAKDHLGIDGEDEAPISEDNVAPSQ